LTVAARFAPPNVLLVVQDERLVARRLDLDALEVVGEPRTVATGVDYIAQFDLPPVSASQSDRLVYHPPSRQEMRQVRRFDRAGNLLESLGDPGDGNLDLSPDGARLASMRFDAERKPSIWIRDLARGVASRLATDGPADGPVWSPDGRSIAYVSFASPLQRLVVRPAAGGAERALWSTSEWYLGEPVDWSPDGSTILVEAGSPGERTNLLLVSADGSGVVTPFVRTAANEHSGRFSPDGRYIAYVANEDGENQIFVQPVPPTGARWLVSPRAGISPRWSGNGLELLYVEPGERSGAATLVAVAVTQRGDGLTFGQATPLGPIASADYEPMPGGRELLVGAPIAEGVTAPPVLIDGWSALLAPP
jgi:dipeptidyl aminopeptidase/acylaminoacyl peptidase